MSSHLRVILATPTFVIGAVAMLITRRILGRDGEALVGWWTVQDALALASQEREFALAAEARYAGLLAYVEGGGE